jgi:hypothetical protein
MNTSVGITLLVKFLMTAVIFPPFHTLVDHFNFRWRLRKAVCMGGIVPLCRPDPNRSAGLRTLLLLCSWHRADVQRGQSVESRCFDHRVDFDIFISRADARAARADLYRRYASFVVDIRVGPDARAVGGFVFDLFIK